MSRPELMVVLPVYELLPENTCVPLPISVRPPGPLKNATVSRIDAVVAHLQGDGPAGRVGQGQMIGPRGT